MITRLHNCFGKYISDYTEIPKEYVIWSYLPDKDMYNWHRYWYHRISQFDELYNDKFLTSGINITPNKKYISCMLLSHLYLDMLSGPIKVFDGWNVTVLSDLLKIVTEKGYRKSINKTYGLIYDPSEQLFSVVKTFFKENNEYYDYKTYCAVMFQRLVEETIGFVDIDKHIELVNLFCGDELLFSVKDDDYEKLYRRFKQMELDIISLD